MANTTSKLLFVTDMLSDFSPVKFYKKYGGYKLREEVEKDLLAQLKIVKETGNSKQAYKAKKHIENFSDMICSTGCEEYWDVRIVRDARKRTEKRKTIHDYNIEYNVYREHDAHSSKIANATEDDVLPTKKDLNDEINNFFQSSPEQKSNNPIKRRRKQQEGQAKFEEQEFIFTSEEEEDSTSGDNDSDYTPSGAEDQSPSSLLLSSQLKEFKKSYIRMNVAQKWFLSSGKCVEDTIYEHCKQLPVETYLHSWIIDLGDQEAEMLFNAEEWDEIRHTVRKTPEVDVNFAKSMMRFDNVSSRVMYQY